MKIIICVILLFTSLSVSANCIDQLNESTLKGITVVLINKLSLGKQHLKRDINYRRIKGPHDPKELKLTFPEHITPVSSFLAFLEKKPENKDLTLKESICMNGFLSLKEPGVSKALFKIRALHWQERITDLKYSDPEFKAKENFKKKRYSFMGINGFAGNVPVGLSDKERARLKNYKIIPDPDTGDVIESTEHKKYIDEATTYASSYNKKMFQLIFHRKKN